MKTIWKMSFKNWPMDWRNKKHPVLLQYILNQLDFKKNSQHVPHIIPDPQFSLNEFLCRPLLKKVSSMNVKRYVKRYRRWNIWLLAICTDECCFSRS